LRRRLDGDEHGAGAGAIGPAPADMVLDIDEEVTARSVSALMKKQLKKMKMTV